MIRIGEYKKSRGHVRFIWIFGMYYLVKKFINIEYN